MILKYGSTGDSVRFLQSSLNTIKVSGMVPLVVDGKFGELTEKTVKAFQKSKGLLSDGIVGPLTQSAISNELKKIPNAPAVLINSQIESKKEKNIVPMVLIGIGIFLIFASSKK